MFDVQNAKNEIFLAKNRLMLLLLLLLLYYSAIMI